MTMEIKAIIILPNQTYFQQIKNLFTSTHRDPFNGVNFDYIQVV
jgi:hypothetical protein